MDPLLAAIIALIVFALMIFLIGRSVRLFMVVGGAITIYLALRFLEVLG